jgi:energy-coupling factor transporter ATP-binding protein EcfA2
VAICEQTRTGLGSIVFLAGPTGSGKSALLRAMPHAVAGAAAEKRLELVATLCYETSTGNTLGPFGEVLRALTNHERRGRRSRIPHNASRSSHVYGSRKRAKRPQKMRLA